MLSGALVSSASVSVPSAGHFNLFATGVAIPVAAAVVTGKGAGAAMGLAPRLFTIKMS